MTVIEVLTAKQLTETQMHEVEDHLVVILGVFEIFEYELNFQLRQDTLDRPTIEIHDLPEDMNEVSKKILEDSLKHFLPRYQIIIVVNN